MKATLLVFCALVCVTLVRAINRGETDENSKNACIQESFQRAFEQKFFRPEFKSWLDTNREELWDLVHDYSVCKEKFQESFCMPPIKLRTEEFRKKLEAGKKDELALAMKIVKDCSGLSF